MRILDTSLVAFCQCLVDEIYSLTFDELSALGLKPNEQHQIDAQQFSVFRQRLKGRTPDVSAGGAGMNALSVHAVLGGRSKVICRVGDDANAHVCLRHAQDCGVEVHAIRDAQRPTGTSLIFVTPDGARTICTCLGAAGFAESSELSQELFPINATTLIEGYMLGIPGEAPRKLFKQLHARGHKIALLIAAPWIPSRFAEAVKEVHGNASFVFMNKVEGESLSGLAKPLEGALALSTEERVAIVTDGEAGAYIAHKGHVTHIPAVQTTVFDSTGAGDSFVGSFLRGYLGGRSLAQAGKGAALVASKVVSVRGAHPPAGTRAQWERTLFE